MKILGSSTSIRNRFAFSMGAMLLPLILLGFGTFISIEEALSRFEKSENETLEELFPVTDLETLIVTASTSADDYLSYGTSDARDRFLRVSGEVDKAFITILNTPTDTPEKTALLLVAQKAWQQAKSSGEAICTNPHLVGSTLATQEKKQLDAQIEQATETLDRLQQLLTHLQISDNVAQAQNAKLWVKTIVVVVFGLGLGVAAIASLTLARSVLIPLQILAEGVKHLAEEDLSHRIVLSSQDELGQLAMMFNQMAEKLEQSQTALRNLATLDELTGVFNRREFNQKLKTEIERSHRYMHPCSLIMLDIDYFKHLNDTYGHQAGDEALKAVASIIKREIRPVDVLARYGGEEFAAILPETLNESAAIVAERLRHAVAAEAIAISLGRSINVTVSIGHATFPTDAILEEKLLGAADQALYAAKHSGRNQVVSYCSLQVGSHECEILDLDKPEKMVMNDASI